MLRRAGEVGRREGAKGKWGKAFTDHRPHTGHVLHHHLSNLQSNPDRQVRITHFMEEEMKIQID